MVACTPEKFEGASADGKPTTDGVSVSVEVDQSTNTATFTSSHLTGAYPLWYVQGRTADGETEYYSTKETFSRVYALSGDKTVTFRTANRNGFSDGSIVKTFHIDNSLSDLSAIAKALTSDEGKQWRVADEEEYHFACGPKGSDGTGTWTVDVANTPELALYDDYIILKTGTSSGNFLYTGTMSYNPGDDGKCQFGGYGESDSKAAAAQESNYKISVSGDDVLLSFDAGTYFPFIPSESFLNDPVFRIESYGSDLLTLVATDGDTAWRLVLTSTDFGGGELGWTGFTSGTNLLAGVEPTFSYWCADDNWSQISDPVQSGSADKGYKFVLPAVGSTQWQAQIHMNYNVTLSAEKTYDFSVTIVSDADVVINATVKPHKTGDDNTYFSADQHPLSKGSNVIAMSECAGWDGEFTLTLDFAGAPEGTTISLQNIFLAEHDAGNVVPYDYSDEGNIWRTGVEATNDYEMFYWWGDANWSQISDPGFAVKQKKTGANIYTITAPAATSAQWQAQTAFRTKLTATATDVVNFSCVIVPNVDLSNVTVKLTDTSDDNNYFFAGQHNLKAGVANVVKYTGASLSGGADASALSLFFDFGGNPEGAVIQITDITLIKQ